MAVLTQPARPPGVYDVFGATCPSRDLLNLVTSRWAVLIVATLAEGPVRFGELRRRLEGISQKVLTDKLRDLEREGLLVRTVVPKPLAVEYALTEVGHTLCAPLAVLCSWATTHCDAKA